MKAIWLICDSTWQTNFVFCVVLIIVDNEIAMGFNSNLFFISTCHAYDKEIYNNNNNIIYIVEDIMQSRNLDFFLYIKNSG